MSNSIKWIIFLILGLILSAFFAYVWPCDIKERSVNMEQNIATALAGTGVSVAMSGNDAILTGTVSSEEEKNRIMKIAEDARCTDCWSPRKWHNVNGIDLMVDEGPKLPSPYTFLAVSKSAGGVTLNGYVPTEEDRVRILADAERFYPGRVTDDKVIVSDGAPAAGWSPLISSQLACLDMMEEGELKLSDTLVSLSGKVADENTQAKINANCSEMPEPFSTSLNLEVLPQIESVDECQTLLNEVNALGDIKFAYNSAEIQGDPSFDLLNGLASAAKRCAAFEVTVEGHTDSDGSDAYNKMLSEQRAQSVVAYLADRQGIAMSRLTAIGYGESQPIADNSTPEGKAQNRRIAFTVSRSE